MIMACELFKDLVVVRYAAGFQLYWELTACWLQSRIDVGERALVQCIRAMSSHVCYPGGFAASFPVYLSLHICVSSVAMSHIVVCM